jgi:uncharacterized protein
MSHIPAAFHVMTKPRGAICNLDCRYCYYLPKETLYPGSPFRMSDEVLEQFTRQYIAAQKVNRVTFAWQGGEPLLMGLAFYERALHLQRKYARPGMRIENTLQTNGTLIDKDWARFFEQHNFLVGLSLDGPRELHNAYRVNKGGAGSFDEALRGWELLHTQGVETNLLCCVHAANQDAPLEVYRFFRDTLRVRFIQFIPIVARGADFSVEPQKYGRFLTTIFDEWVRRDVGSVFVQMFDVALGAWLSQPGGLCVFAPTCGTALALEHSGDLYSCDHFVESGYYLGNILQESLSVLVGDERQVRFGQAKLTRLPRACLECKVRFACHGGCPKERFLQTSEGESGLNYLCAGYKAFFEHIDPYMQSMAGLFRQNRPPREIMRLLAAGDGGKTRYAE